MENPNYYAIVPAFVRYDTKICANAKLLYGEITALTNSRGYCFAQNIYFAKLYKKDISTISRWISQLVTAGHIKIDLIYKKNTKEIEERHIFLCPPTAKNARPYTQKTQDPHLKKRKDNNTSINNTSINIYNYVKCRFTFLRL